MHILLVFPHYDSPDSPGSVRSWQIGRYLATAGHQVTALAPGVHVGSEETLPEMGARLYVSSVQDGVRIIRVRTLAHFRGSALHRLLFELLYGILSFVRCMSIREVGLVLASYPPAIAPYLAYVQARLRGVPFVFEVRDLMAGALRANRYVGLRPFQRVAHAAEGYLLARSDHVVAAGTAMREAVVSRGADPGKITVIGQAYEPEVFAAADYSTDVRVAYGWRDRFLVAYVGALNNTVDIPTLLGAAQILREYEDLLFVIVGGGERKQEYVDFCADQDLDNVQFVDSLPRRQVPVLLSAANLGVNMLRDDPLWEYYLGNKLFDYWGSGIPVLYAGPGEVVELIRRSRAGVVVAPEDAGALAQAILWFRDHPDESAAMGRRGHEFVVTHYSRPDVLAPLEPALAQLVEAV